MDRKYGANIPQRCVLVKVTHDNQIQRRMPIVQVYNVRLVFEREDPACRRGTKQGELGGIGCERSIGLVAKIDASRSLFFE